MKIIFSTGCFFIHFSIMPVREWTDAQRAFLVEKKIQRAGFAQIHAEYALR